MMFRLDQQYCIVHPLPNAVAVTRPRNTTHACFHMHKASCVAAAYEADTVCLAYKYITADHHNYYYMLSCVARAAACLGFSRHTCICCMYAPSKAKNK